MTELSDQHLSNSPKEFKIFRPLALVLEGIPICLILLSLLIENQKLLIIGFWSLALLYPLGGWYLFKSRDYKVWDIILATFFGLLLSIVLLGMLFELADWEFGQEMLAVGSLTLQYAFGFSLVYMIVRNIRIRDTKSELRTSLKIFARFTILV
ncbi:MAG: hypothetical protein AAGM67_13715, partial [Bacteroidota bacterium]